MTDIQHPTTEATGSSVFAGIIKTISLLATGAWAFAVLAFMAALNGPGWSALALLIVLIFGTPVFVIFVLPALLFSFLGGEPGAKVGAGFLVAGVLVAGAVFATPMLRTMM
jgi:hypothetical protein